MVKRSEELLGHILDSILLVESYLKGVRKESFSRNSELQDAVIRRIAIIGEAAHALPADVKGLSPEVPWEEAIAMRNILIHEYFGVSTNIVWDTAKRDLPALKRSVKKTLKKLER